jgi:hypothetical protein
MFMSGLIRITQSNSDKRIQAFAESMNLKFLYYQKLKKNKVVVPACQATKPGGIGSLASILGLLKSLKIRALSAL